MFSIITLVNIIDADHQKNLCGFGIGYFFKPVKYMIGQVAACTPVPDVIPSKMLLEVKTFGEAVAEEYGVGSVDMFRKMNRVQGLKFEV